MKNILRLFALALVLSLPLSCVSELTELEDNSATDVQNTITIRASLEQNVTKTSLNEAYSVVWNSGDQIRVFNASNPNGVVFTLDAASAGQTQGTFTGSALSGSGPYYAVYPASAASSLSGSAVRINLASTQTATAAGSFAAGANVAAGVAADISEIYFKNVCGVLAVTLKGSKSVSQIRMTADGNEWLSGTGSVSLSLTEEPSLQLESGSSSVILNISKASALSSAGSTFYMVVPAGSLAEGFAVEVIDTQGGAMTKHAAGENSNTVKRSEVRPMPALSYTPEVNSAWLDIQQPGVYKGILPGQTVSTILAWNEEDGQYAWGTNTSSPLMFRIQDWEAGYSVRLSLMTERLIIGKSFSADIVAKGSTSSLASSSGVTMKLLRREAGMLWLTDGTNGFIMKAEEE